jgi:hypothetical protein
VPDERDLAWEIVREKDVLFGRAAIQSGLATREVVSGIFNTLAPTMTLKDELVRRGFLSREQAEKLESSAGGTPAPPRGSVLPGPGDRVGDYEIESLLGKGGMGAVFKGRHGATGQEAAIKVLLLEDDAREDQLERFRREAAAMAKVDRHAGIVRIRTSGTFGPRQLPFAVLDFVRGHDLAHELKNGPVPVARAFAVTAKVARAIAHCHAQGVLHRDLKPANVLVREEDGEPLVTDFGLARDAALSRLTKTGELLGTPSYMAPEQAEGAASEHDERTDVYGLGAILYECLSGGPPFKAASHVALVKKVLFDEPADPRSRCPQVPRDASVVALKCLAKEKHHRYASAADLAEELERLIQGEPILARPPTRVERLVRRARRRPLIAAGWTLGPIVVAFAVLLAWKLEIDATMRVEKARTAARTLREKGRLPARGPVDAAAVASADALLANAEVTAGPDDGEVVLLRHYRDLLAAPEKVLAAPGMDAADAAAAIALLPENADARRVAERYLQQGAGGEDQKAVRALLDYSSRRASPSALEELVKSNPGERWRGAVEGAIVETLDATASVSSKARGDALDAVARLAAHDMTSEQKVCVAGWICRLEDPARIVGEEPERSIILPLIQLVRTVKPWGSGRAMRASLLRIQRLWVHAEASSICASAEKENGFANVEAALTDLGTALSLTDEPMREEVRRVLAQAGFTSITIDPSDPRRLKTMFALYAVALRQGYFVPDTLARIMPEEWDVPPPDPHSFSRAETEDERQRSLAVARLAFSTAFLNICREGFRSYIGGSAPDWRPLVAKHQILEHLDEARAALEGPLFQSVGSDLRDRLRAIECFERAEGVYARLLAPGSATRGAAASVAEIDAVIAGDMISKKLGNPREFAVDRALLNHFTERCEAKTVAKDAAGARADAEAIEALGAEMLRGYERTRREQEELILLEEKGSADAKDKLDELRLQGLYTIAGDKTIWAETCWKAAVAWEQVEKLGDGEARVRRRSVLEKGLDLCADPNRRVELALILESEGRLEDALAQVRAATDGGVGTEPFTRRGAGEALRLRVLEKLGRK